MPSGFWTQEGTTGAGSLTGRVTFFRGILGHSIWALPDDIANILNVIRAGQHMLAGVDKLNAIRKGQRRCRPWLPVL